MSTDSPIFREPVSRLSIYKTLTKGVSGVAYEDYDASLTFPMSSLIGLIAFAIIVQVLFLNLATGLAIEDVKKMRVEAEMSMNILKIQHIFAAGRFLTFHSQICKFIPFMKQRKPMRRFQNMATTDFRPEIIDQIRVIERKEEAKETQNTGNVLSVSFKLDIDQLARLKIGHTGET